MALAEDEARRGHPADLALLICTSNNRAAKGSPPNTSELRRGRCGSWRDHGREHGTIGS